MVAKELTERDTIAAHVRDELGINETSQSQVYIGCSYVSYNIYLNRHPTVFSRTLFTLEENRILFVWFCHCFSDSISCHSC